MPESTAPGRPDPELVEELFASYVRDRERSVRNRIVELNTGLAIHIARRFGPGRRDIADLEQVALLGLVKAVERFDPSFGVSFATFAGRTLEGELKRHLRDATWNLHVPRSLKDLHVSVRTISDELIHRLGRAPSIGEVAAELGVSRDDVIEALGAGAIRNPQSLDRPAGGETDHSPELGLEGGTSEVDDRDQIARLMGVLDDREREIVRLRFEESLSQDAIAERLDISQMHVSRLLRRSLEAMREAGADQGFEVDQ